MENVGNLKLLKSRGGNNWSRTDAIKLYFTLDAKALETFCHLIQITTNSLEVLDLDFVKQTT